MSEHKLPRKTLILWQIRIGIIAAFCLGGLTYYCRFFSWYLPVFIVAVILSLIILLWYLPALFKTYSVKYMNGAVVIESGVFIKVTHIMPFSKMIYTQSITSPLAKMFGLSAVILKAARSRILIPEINAEDVENFARILAEGESK